MPVQSVQNTIEVGSFVAGWVASPEESGTPIDALADVTNLILDASNGSVVTRPGFVRLFTDVTLKGYRIYTLSFYTASTGAEYLMAVL